MRPGEATWDKQMPEDGETMKVLGKEDTKRNSPDLQWSERSSAITRWNRAPRQLSSKGSYTCPVAQPKNVWQAWLLSFSKHAVNPQLNLHGSPSKKQMDSKPSPHYQYYHPLKKPPPLPSNWCSCSACDPSGFSQIIIQNQSSALKFYYENFQTYDRVQKMLIVNRDIHSFDPTINIWLYRWAFPNENSKSKVFPNPTLIECQHETQIHTWLYMMNFSQK